MEALPAFNQLIEAMQSLVGHYQSLHTFLKPIVNTVHDEDVGKVVELRSKVRNHALQIHGFASDIKQSIDWNTLTTERVDEKIQEATSLFSENSKLLEQVDGLAATIRTSWARQSALILLKTLNVASKLFIALTVAVAAINLGAAAAQVAIGKAVELVIGSSVLVCSSCAVTWLTDKAQEIIDDSRRSLTLMHAWLTKLQFSLQGVRRTLSAKELLEIDLAKQQLRAQCEALVSIADDQ
eukprot:c529_g1_i1.p1 GENE.c529_g1_i1~~c529_g1_i1.p1  ORF type:complete len:239 (+),score=54.63 c529_g1_i1:303-1019(+)